MRAWSEVRDDCFNSGRFTELAMTGTIDEAVDLILSAIEMANDTVSEEFKVSAERAEIRRDVLTVRKPIECPSLVNTKGSQLDLFGEG